MGNQGYSNEGTRQVAEIIWAGDIGSVSEVHAWTGRPLCVSSEDWRVQWETNPPRQKSEAS